jgi:SET domain-containing protein
MSILVKDSGIHGKGVFAARDIRMGETIIHWNSCTEILSEEEALALSTEEQKYLSYIDGQIIKFKPPARFVNHSCTPNAQGGNGRDTALRNIAAGEEITVDYDVENVTDQNFECCCSSGACRKNLCSS